MECKNGQIETVGDSCGNKVRGEKNNFNDKLAQKWSWPNLKYYSDICLEGLRYAMKILRITSVRTGI
jgi:hypothetical protein